MIVRLRSVTAKGSMAWVSVAQRPGHCKPQWRQHQAGEQQPLPGAGQQKRRVCRGLPISTDLKALGRVAMMVFVVVFVVG